MNSFEPKMFLVKGQSARAFYVNNFELKENSEVSLTQSENTVLRKIFYR
jgi:hypothetical protein